MVLAKLSVIFVICTLWFDVECLFVKFERAQVILTNENYAYNVSVFVRRYSRKTPYCLHVIGSTKQMWNNNITVDIIFNQFLHNEYRPSFVELHYKFCDLINGEPYVGGMLKMFGVTCPMYPGLHKFINMTAPTQNFPNVFPFEKGRVDGTFSLTATKEPVLIVQVEATFKQ